MLNNVGGYGIMALYCMQKGGMQSMKCGRLIRFLAAGVLAPIIIFLLVFDGAAAAASGSRRFNVVVVLDASGSILDTDPDGYRYEAVARFVFCLAEQGNNLGGVVFNTGVLGEQELLSIRSQQDKDAVLEKISSISARSGWTNIGAALDRAVTMLKEDGDPSLPSVILFFSDGNTAMGSDKETQAALDLKSEAIQAARDNHIAVYGVCLNADHSADMSEMRQICEGTGGECREVTSAEDLQPVFDFFYSLLHDIDLPESISTVVPDSGYLETPFDVPGIGVEEVNITVYGSLTEVKLLRPDGTEDTGYLRQDTSLSTMLKLKGDIPGRWTLVTKGVPGSSIEVNIIPTPNLGIEVEADPAEQTVTTQEEVTVYARLVGPEGAADRDEQYTGYSARLHILDNRRQSVESIPMELTDGRFRAVYRFPEGSYFYRVQVTGNHIDRSSETFGPLTCTPPGAGTKSVPVNHPPEPVEAVVKATVKIWPFKGGSYTLDLNTLATDDEDSELYYEILSSSFLEGEDYTVDSGGILRMDRFSLSKGAYTVRATDSGGLSCEIEVVVRAINIGILTLIGIGVLALIGAIVFAVLLYIALNKPFRGTISAISYCNGMYRGTPRTPRRGRCKLAAFGMDNVGLNYQKSYFQATGKSYIELNTDIPVLYNGQKTKKVRITSGAEVSIALRQGDPTMLYIRFDSRMQGMRPNGGRRGAPRKPGVRR